MTTPELVTLNEDQAAVAQRLLRDIHMGAGTIIRVLADGEKLQVELARNVLSVTEYRMAELGKLLDIPTKSAEEVERRHADLRRANMRVRELESMLGQSQTPAVALMTLRGITEQVYNWWRLEGFGHVSEEAFTQYGMKVKFSCHLFGNFRLLDSDTPVSDEELREQWHAELRQRGFEFSESESEMKLLDNDSNRRLLCALFATRLPSSQVTNITNWHTRKDGFVMRDIEVYIRNLDEIAALPVPPEAKADA